MRAGRGGADKSPLRLESAAQPGALDPRDLVGTYEVAAYLGWSPGQVADYAAKGAAGMPAPFARLRCGRVWLRQEIEAWVLRRGYRTRGQLGGTAGGDAGD